ncbi:hypothetical protein GIR22_11590 [Pseudomonas sp. CCM 7891]|uniref:Uncharacterized protein n=1 Tax=Pseudomonas karstica TaxID=1055468 RepID=A0A7X2RTK6_9PSED|nr:hypothetical protein [Pseudomonas karstica]MTD19765.1 hypothetical protein [Pseudomonas karstica]
MKCISNLPMLTAPTLPQAHRHGINALAATQLQVDIAPYPGMDEGDLIELFWNDCFIASRCITAGKVGTSTRLRIPESFIQSGAVRIHYQVMQVGHGPAQSAATCVQVKVDYPGGRPKALCNDENQNLAPVNLPEMIRRYGVNSRQVLRGVPLIIEPYLNMAADDEITLRWGDARLDLSPIQACDIAKPIQVWVPSALIQEAGDDHRLEVTYCILDWVGNNSRWAPARTLRIAAAHPHPLIQTVSAYQPRRPGSPCEAG